MVGMKVRSYAQLAGTLLLFVGVLAGDVTDAHADEKDDARKLLANGDKYLERGDRRRDGGREQRAVHYYEKALAAYKKAHTLVPKASIFYAIANAEARLGRYGDAIAHYESVISEVDNKALIDLCRERIKELAVHMATVTIRIEPDGAELSIDNKLHGIAPIKEPIILVPGEHTFTVTADGYTPNEMVMNLEAGSDSKPEVVLDKNSVLVKKPRNVDEEDPDFKVPETRILKRPGKGRLILGSVITGTFLAAAGVTGYLTATAEEDSRTPLLISTIATGVLALAAGGYTAYHYFGQYRPRKKAAKQQAIRLVPPKFWVSPYVHAEGGGVAVGGPF